MGNEGEAGCAAISTAHGCRCVWACRKTEYGGVYAAHRPRDFRRPVKRLVALDHGELQRVTEKL